MIHQKNLSLAMVMIVILTSSIFGQYEVDLSGDTPTDHQNSGIIPTRLIESSGIIRGGREKTAQGILKVPIVFIRFQEDDTTSQYWPYPDSLPNLLQGLLDSVLPGNNIFEKNNLSKYYDLFSGGNGIGSLGEFKVIGKVFYITMSKKNSMYGSDGEITLEVLDSLDKKINFREFDNWKFMVNNEYFNHQYSPYNPKTGASADGILDCMVIFSRRDSKSLGTNVGGYASLGNFNTVYKDGVSINSYCGILGFKAFGRSDKRIMAIIAHEIGHHQFGFGIGFSGSHYDGKDTLLNYNMGNIHDFGLMTTYDCHHFNAYEKYRLGWLDPQIISSNMSYVELNETFL